MLSAAQTPSATPIATAIAVATRTCENVSIAGRPHAQHADRDEHRERRQRGAQPLTTKAIAVSPATVDEPGRLDEELLQRLEQL